MSWGKFWTPKDSKGRESRTLFFIAVAFAVITIRYFFQGLGIEWGPIKFIITDTSMVEFSGSVTALLGIWLGREWINVKKVEKGQTDDR